MRDTFVAALLEIARHDSRVMLVTGDLGFGVLDKFRKELPEQYINAGVAEQNMTGLATGMALEGRVVFTYSIANFPTLRCLEQIRNDAVYHGANVKVVAIGGGFSYGALGMSHHATEDVAILRALPGLSVYAPCDESETRELTAHLVANDGPGYLRLDKSKAAVRGAPVVPGRLRCLREGRDVAIIAYGGIVEEALKVAESLSASGTQCAVYSAHTLKPFDDEGVLQIATSGRLLITLEEHVPNGGLGSTVADVLLGAGVLPRRFVKISLPDVHSAIVGSQEYMRARLGLDQVGILRRIRQALEAG